MLQRQLLSATEPVHWQRLRPANHPTAPDHHGRTHDDCGSDHHRCANDHYGPDHHDSDADDHHCSASDHDPVAHDDNHDSSDHDHHDSGPLSVPQLHLWTIDRSRALLLPA
jgi:hypothetical protein